MSKVVTKKRSSVREQSILTPPKGFDHKKYSGRWVADSRLNVRTDGYEARGFQPWKNDEGKVVKVGDLTWCYMTKEDAALMKQEKIDAAVDQISSVNAKIAEQDSRLTFELEKAGGKLETTVSVE